MIKASHIISILFLSIFCQGCSNENASKNSAKVNKKTIVNGKKYILTIYKDKINAAGNKFEPNNQTDSLIAANDTVAYLTALKTFYNQKIAERKDFNYGQPKSFTIVDANGVDLKVTLSDKITTGLKNQVENAPDVKKMLEEYQKDSL